MPRPPPGIVVSAENLCYPAGRDAQARVPHVSEVPSGRKPGKRAVNPAWSSAVFDDAMVSLMVMLLLSFAGMLVMFLFVIRSQSSQTAALREWFRQHQAILAEVEQQLMNIHFTLRQLQLKKSEPPENRTEALLPSGDLRDLFGPLPEGRRDRKAELPETRIDPPPARDYAYPSAAGLDSAAEDFLSLPRPSSGKKGGRGAFDLDLKLDR
jgi:hypothetical protein